jgi:hypothetical protein
MDQIQNLLSPLTTFFKKNEEVHCYCNFFKRLRRGTLRNGKGKWKNRRNSRQHTGRAAATGEVGSLGWPVRSLID